jgi:hypothetical protein
VKDEAETEASPKLLLFLDYIRHKRHRHLMAAFVFFFPNRQTIRQTAKLGDRLQVIRLAVFNLRPHTLVA